MLRWYECSLDIPGAPVELLAVCIPICMWPFSFHSTYILMPQWYRRYGIYIDLDKDGYSRR